MKRKSVAACTPAEPADRRRGDGRAAGARAADTFCASSCWRYLTSDDLIRVEAPDPEEDLRYFVLTRELGRPSRRKLAAPPDMYSPGSEEEGALCLLLAGDTWRNTPGALDWLRQQTVLPPRPKPPGRRKEKRRKAKRRR